MVGVPRSRGCLLCVRRRVRCDEGRPGCAKCSKYGAECPGYDRSRKFVAGKHVVRRGQTKEARREATAGKTDTADAEALQNGKSVVVARGRSDDNDASFFGISPPRGMFVASLLEELYCSRRRGEMLLLGPWFTRLPLHVGQRATLDSAACALTMHLLGKSRDDKTMVVRSRQLYGQALVALQRALDHPVEWKTSETLCSTMLLCLFELFADTGSDSSGWLHHSRAVSRLIQLRGVDGYRHEWDRAMLFSFRTIIIMDAIFTTNDCFLAKPKWQRVLGDVSDFGQPVMTAHDVRTPYGPVFTPSAIPVIDQLIVCLARLPSVMHVTWALRQARQHGLPTDAAQTTQLRRTARRLHADLLAWHERATRVFGLPLTREVPSASRIGPLPVETVPSPYPMVLAFPNAGVGAICLNHVAAQLVVQEALNQCTAVLDGEEAPLPFVDDNRRLCNILLRSLETVGEGLMGSYRVGFAMRMAYEFSDVPRQQWILSRIKQCQDVFEAVRSTSYPPPAPNEYNYN